jgi:hypothetical protein
MRIVLPVSAHDHQRLPLLVDIITHFAGLQAHEILLVPTASVTELTNVQADRLRSVCPKVEVAPMDHDPQWGWFTAPNMQWFHAVYHMHHVMRSRSPWFWMEVDCVPVKADWANQLAAEYMSGGKPFCGCVVDTPYRDAQGNVAPTPPGDRMMMGCGIYPPGIPADLEIAPLFLDLCKPPPYNADQPWDVYLRWVMMKRGMAHTPLIGDMWNTGNYRMEGGRLICDALPSKHQGRARGGVVSPDCVVVHGCKDETLYRLVLAPAAGDVGYTLDTPKPQVDDPPGTYTLTEFVPTKNPLVNSIRREVESRLNSGGITLKGLGQLLKEPPDVLEPLLPSALVIVKGPAKWLGLAGSKETVKETAEV